MKERFLGWLAATLIRGVGLTLRFSLDDRAGICAKPPEGPMIWAFWHNSLLGVTLGYRRFMPSRKGAVLTSPSKDGEVLAAALKCFGADAVRGSSSRRGATALLGLVEWIRNGYDVAITPDGPRGPRCRVQPGLVKLAEKTGVPILPIRVVCHRAYTLNSWDRFMVPLPFSKVDIVFEELQEVDQSGDESVFEAERQRIESLLNGESQV